MWSRPKQCSSSHAHLGGSLILRGGDTPPLGAPSEWEHFPKKAWKDALTERNTENIGAALFLTLNEIFCAASHMAVLVHCSVLPSKAPSYHSFLAFLPGSSECWCSSGLSSAHLPTPSTTFSLLLTSPLASTATCKVQLDKPPRAYYLFSQSSKHACPPLLDLTWDIPQAPQTQV